MNCFYPKCSTSKAAKKVCSRCKKATYCSRECQKKHFKEHKRFCVPPTTSSSSGQMDTKSLVEKSNSALLSGIKQAEAELQEAMKKVAEARAAAEQIQVEVAEKQAKYNEVKKREDEAAATMERAMASLRTGGLDGNGLGLGLEKNISASQQSQSSAPNYGEKEYWNKRYRGEGNAGKGDHIEEWYLNFSHIDKFLTGISRAEKPILDVGCGVSLLGEELLEAGGFKSVICIDYSDVAIDKMKTRDNKPGLQYMTMDASKMSFPDNYFGAAVDKGTIDAVMSGEDADGVSRAIFVLKEVHRVLAPKGKFILVSSVPKMMYLPMLNSAHLSWRIEAEALKTDAGEVDETDTMFGTWIYTFTK